MDLCQASAKLIDLTLVKDFHGKHKRAQTFLGRRLNEGFSLLDNLRVLGSTLLQAFSDYIISTFHVEFKLVVAWILNQDRHPASLTREVHAADDLKLVVVRAFRVSHVDKTTIELHDGVKRTLTGVVHEAHLALLPLISSCSDIIFTCIVEDAAHLVIEKQVVRGVGFGNAHLSPVVIA